jgi:ferredoxin-NADP reductase
MSATSYCHLARAAGDLTVETLQERDFFKTRQLAGGEGVTPIELIAETAPVWTPQLAAISSARQPSGRG